MSQENPQIPMTDATSVDSTTDVKSTAPAAVAGDEQQPQELVHETGQEPVHEPVPELVEPPQEPVQEPSHEPAQEPPQEPSQEPVQEQQPVPVPVPEPVPVQDSEINASDDDSDNLYEPEVPEITSVSVEQPQEPEESDDEAYDPTATVSDEEPTASAANYASTIGTSQPTPPQAQSTEPQTSAQAQAHTTDPLIEQLTTRLLSDPSFLRLTPQEQQTRVAQEYIALQGASVSQSYASPPQQQQQQYQSYNQEPYKRQRPVFEQAPHRPDLTQPMSPEEHDQFRAFLNNEEQYNTRYPHAPNSRLFVGNIPSNHVQKPELWRIFRKYGKILQVSMKTAYGFVQFDNAEAVENAIAGESVIPLFNKVLNLAVAKNSRPDEMQQASSRSNKDPHKRTRDQSPPRRSAKSRRALECQIFVKPDGNSDDARDVSRVFENNGIVTEYTFLSHQDDMSKMVNDAAYAGVIGVVLIGRGNGLDTQIFQETPDGALRFDEYVNLNTNDALNLILREKESKRPQVKQQSRESRLRGSRNEYDERSSRRGGDRYDDRSRGGRRDRDRDQRDRGDPYSRNDRNDRGRSDDRRSGFNDRPSYDNRGGDRRRGMSPSRPQQATEQNLLQSLSSLPPDALQNLITLAQTQSAQPQGYQPSYQSYQQPQQYQQQPQQTQVPPAAINALLSSFGAPQPQQQQQQHQQQQQQPQGGKVASLLESLARLQK